MTPENKIEEKAYHLQAQLNHYRRLAVSILGRKRVAQIEKNSTSAIKEELERIRYYPLTDKQ